MPSICLVYGFGVALSGFARAGLDGLCPPRAFGGSVFCHLPSAFLCQGALSKPRAFLARFLVCTAKPGGWLTCRCAASASTAFYPRRRCVACSSPVQPRRISHVGRVTYWG